jgi:hypothetical protein
VEKPYEVSQLKKIRRDSVPITQAIFKGIELIEEAKVEAFETSKNLPRRGNKFSSSGGSTTTIRSCAKN